MRSIDTVFSIAGKVFLWRSPDYYLFGFKHCGTTFVMWSRKRKAERHALSIPKEFRVPCLNVDRSDLIHSET